jgi:O-antigen ligase
LAHLASGGRAAHSSRLEPELERAQLGLVAALAASGLVSIFAGQALLAAGILIYLTRLLLGTARLRRLPVDGPILAFGVWSLLSASFAPDPPAAYEDAKKLVLFAILYLAVDCLSNEDRRERVVDALLLGGCLLGGWVLLQYHALGYDSLNNRPSGFLGHYMTAAGLCMGVLVLAASRLAFWDRSVRLRCSDAVAPLGVAAVLGLLTLLHRLDVATVEAQRILVLGLAATAAWLSLSRSGWPSRSTGLVLAAVAAPVCAWALVVSRTRNAWIGAIAGLCLVAVLRAPKALLLLAGSLAVVLLLRPAPVVDRLTWSDASSRDRYYMWQAGIDMVLDKPVFGQGPGMILKTYPGYRWPQALSLRAPHLHNNALQLAAERGLPCLALWLWLVAALLGDAYRERRRDRGRRAWPATATLAILTAVMVAGLFEYNFGDSEILMFLLLVSALPYGLRRERANADEAGLSLTA